MSRQASSLHLSSSSEPLHLALNSLLRAAAFALCRWKDNLSEGQLRDLTDAVWPRLQKASLVLQFGKYFCHSHAVFLRSLCRLKTLQTLDASAVLVTLQEAELCQRPVHPENVPDRILRNKDKSV